jgi:hypothetical protein
MDGWLLIVIPPIGLGVGAILTVRDQENKHRSQSSRKGVEYLSVSEGSQTPDIASNSRYSPSAEPLDRRSS